MSKKKQMKFPGSRKRPNPVRGIVAGLVGGLAGAWTMDQFQSIVARVKANCEGTSGMSQKSENNEDATMKTAERVINVTTGNKLTHEEKMKGGPIVHYGFGAATGALYGALVESKRRTGLTEGALLGSALFVGADEIAVPALGLSQPPTEYPLSVHATALATHLIYGVTTETVRRQIRRILK